MSALLDCHQTNDITIFNHRFKKEETKKIVKSAIGLDAFAIYFMYSMNLVEGINL